ncbi:MAG: hypothetical protein H6633_24715 [Anaerolineales bacterium]|nr:hypothetical protein [Anaerolineales bacterium]
MTQFDDLKPGDYSVTEADPVPNFDFTNLECSDEEDQNGASSVDGRTASIKLDPGETVTCTYTNTERGMARVVKTVNNQPPTGDQAFEFQLRQGASTTEVGTTLETQVANAGNGGDITFATKLVPGDTYQLCEVVMPGWMTTLGDFVLDSFLPPDGVAMRSER